VRRFLAKHEVRTILDLNWSESLENGDLLRAAEEASFELLITADQNIPYQQNLAGKKLSLIVLGSNIWAVLRNYGAVVAEKVKAVKPGSYAFIEIPLPPKSRTL
jgi:hypothetical protein